MLNAHEHIPLLSGLGSIQSQNVLARGVVKGTTRACVVGRASLVSFYAVVSNLADRGGRVSILNREPRVNGRLIYSRSFVNFEKECLVGHSVCMVNLASIDAKADLPDILSEHCCIATFHADID